MSFTAAIKFVAQSDPSTFVLQDISNYAGADTKSNISARTLNIFLSDNSALPGYVNPINWPYSAGDSLLITGLKQDYALQIKMTLTAISPQVGSIYAAEADVATIGYLQQGLFNIQVSRLNDGSPSSLSDKIYRNNSVDMLIEQQNSQTGVLYANFTGAQGALDRAQNIINNTQL